MGPSPPHSSNMYLRAADDLDDSIILNELGHILGLDHLYIDTELCTDEAPDNVTECLKEFFGSTMCHDRAALGSAGIAGIRNIYRSITDAATCPTPPMRAHAHLRKELYLCKTSTGFLALIYDHTRVISGYPLYGGTFYRNVASRIDIAATDTVGTFSELNLITADSVRTLKWHIDAVTIGDDTPNCELASWLQKLKIYQHHMHRYLKSEFNIAKNFDQS